MRGLYKKISTLLCAGILAFSLCAGAFAREYQGIDVSVWQGAIDFSQVKKAGKDIVYIRAGYGLTEDTTFRANAKNARSAGMKVGFYFYVTAADAAQAQAQARRFASLIADQSYDCRPAVDFESFSGLTDSECNEIALAFAKTLESAVGVTPLFYTDASSAEYLWDESLKAYPLWVADYGVARPGSTGHWDSWVGFQYSDAGKVNGINDAVDLDTFTDGVFITDSDSLPFTDVKVGDWYYPAVLALYDRNIIKGISGTAFAPNEYASRGAFAAALYRLDGAPAVTGESGFKDVPSGAWYSDGVIWAEANSIAEGVNAEVFDPDVKITRQEAAAFLYRYARYKGLDTDAAADLAVYKDYGSVASWAESAVAWAVGSGIIKGLSADTLAPDAGATRAQMAQMLYRMSALG